MQRNTCHTLYLVIACLFTDKKKERLNDKENKQTMTRRKANHNDKVVKFS